MNLTVADLIDQNYNGTSVRSILTDPKFRKKVLDDKTVRGNTEVKKLVMDKIAVGGKVLLTGPTGEAKTLFARVMLDHITNEINSRKYHIMGCPFLEDAGYLVHIINNYKNNILIEDKLDYIHANFELLTASTTKQNVNHGTNPGGSTTSTQTFTGDQIADRAFYKANREEILLAQKEGRIKG